MYDDYVNEVLEEAAEEYGTGEEDHSYGYDDTLDAQERQRRILEEEERRFQQAQAEEEERLAEAERIANEKVQREREAAFEANLQKMDEEHRKQALQQKRKDAKVVKRVLRSRDRGDLYGVLGLRNWELRFGPKHLKLFSYELELPCQTFFQISPKAIKKAYRIMAKRVHPDKNCDGRAVEAFVSVEEAAAILLDERQRTLYDEKARQERGEQHSRALQMVNGAVGGTFRVAHRSLNVVRRVLGPFAFPIFIITALIV